MSGQARGLWTTRGTAGHETHGQWAIYPEGPGNDIAIVYDGEAHAELIVRAVNCHDELVAALKAIIDYAENETQSLYSLRDSEEAEVEAEKASCACEIARAAIAMAER